MTPAAYRRGGAGVHITYAVVETTLGHLIVAATERGICAVALGANGEELVQGLQQEFPRATLVHHGGPVSGWVDAVARYLNGTATAFDIPVDLHGTEFQLRVWKALQAIPFGSTISYSGLAAEIGQPSATRAVARACATNRVALVVPCHRVVRSGGALGGFRWGVGRKQRLLEREREVSQPSAGSR